MELNLPGFSSRHKAASMSVLRSEADRSGRTAWLLRYYLLAWLTGNADMILLTDIVGSESLAIVSVLTDCAVLAGGSVLTDCAVLAGASVLTDCSVHAACADVHIPCHQHSVLSEFMAQGLVSGCSCNGSCDVQIAVSGIEQLNGRHCLFCTPGVHIRCPHKACLQQSDCHNLAAALPVPDACEFAGSKSGCHWVALM